MYLYLQGSHLRVNGIFSTDVPRNTKRPLVLFVIRVNSGMYIGLHRCFSFIRIFFWFWWKSLLECLKSGFRFRRKRRHTGDSFQVSGPFSLKVNYTTTRQEARSTLVWRTATMKFLRGEETDTQLLKTVKDGETIVITHLFQQTLHKHINDSFNLKKRFPLICAQIKKGKRKVYLSLLRNEVVTLKHFEREKLVNLEWHLKIIT